MGKYTDGQRLKIVKMAMILNESLVIKEAAFGDFMNKLFGYHDLSRVSEISGVPRDQVSTLYHQMRAPNAMLYSYDDISADIKQIHNKLLYYQKLQSGLNATSEGSPEEKSFLKKNKVQLDARLGDYVTTKTDIFNKWQDLKN